MRLGQFSADGGPAWAGVVTADGVVNVASAGVGAGVTLPRRTVDLLGTWRWREKAELAVEHAVETGDGLYDEADVRRRAPVTDPGKVVCVGLNYADHAAESGAPDVPEEPVLFAKFPSAIVGPGDAIKWDPDYTNEVDYEAELVAVLGDRVRDVDPGEALDAVAGYTVGNDVSARDLQFADDQWVRGKTLDTFAPIGPEVVTGDELGDPHDRTIYAEVDGERLQDSSTEHLVFGVDDLVAFCSRAFTLEPGDLVFTGTPSGVGKFRDPPRLLDDGDRVTVGVEGIGDLSNPCRHR